MTVLGHSISSTRRQKLVHWIGDIASTSILRGLGPFSAFLLTVLLARHLGAAQAGAFFIATTIMAFFTIIARFGFDNTLQRFAGGAAGYGDWGRVWGVYRQAKYSTFCLSLFIASVLTLSSGIMVNGFMYGQQSELFVIVSWVIVPFTWSGIHAAMLKAIGQPAWGGFIEVAALPLFAVLMLTISAIFIPVTLSSVAWCFLIAAIIVAILSSLLVKHCLPAVQIEKPVTKDCLFNSCIPLTIVELLNYTLLWSPLIIIGMLSTTHDAGLYNVSHRIAAQLGLLLLVVASITAPRFASHHQTNSTQELYMLAIQSTRWITYITLPVSVFLFIAAEPLLRLFGEEFVQASNILRILIIGYFINNATGPVGYLLTMTGNEKILRNLLFLTTPTALCLAFATIPILGAVGAAWTVTITLTIQNLACCYLVKQRLGFPFLLLFASPGQRR